MVQIDKHNPVASCCCIVKANNSLSHFTFFVALRFDRNCTGTGDQPFHDDLIDSAFNSEPDLNTICCHNRSVSKTGELNGIFRAGRRDDYIR